MAKYVADPKACRLEVNATSNIHDTSSTFSNVTGELTADAATVETAGATGSFRVDMSVFDAGDFLKNRKLKKELDAKKYPEATFQMSSLENVAKDGDQFRGTAKGTLSYRGKELAVEIAGEGTMSDAELRVKGSFELDIRKVGMQPPKILMFKMEPDVRVEITLVAKAS